MDINLQFQQLSCPSSNILKLGEALLNSDKNQKLKIEEAVLADPVISLKILQLAKISTKKAPDTIKDALKIIDHDALIDVAWGLGFNSYSSAKANSSSCSMMRDNSKKSLACALYAGLIAKISGYYNVQNAYLCGLLSQIGKRYLINTLPQQYSPIYQDSNSNIKEKLNQEKKLVGYDSNHICSKIIEPLSPHSWFIDAIKFQDHPQQQLSESHHLCKIIALAKSLSNDTQQNRYDMAKYLFGFDEPLIVEIEQSVTQQLNKQFNKKQESDSQAIQNKLNACLCELNQQLFENPSKHWQNNAIDIGHYLQRKAHIKLNIAHVLLFSKFKNSHTLNGYIHSTNIESPDFKLSIENENSHCIKAFLEKKTIILKQTKKNECISDEQLLNYFNTHNIAFFPIEKNNEILGVAAIGLDNSQLNTVDETSEKMQRVFSSVANALSKFSHKNSNLFNSDNERFEKLIGEVLHETSNPLAIIKNYLNLMQNKEDTTTVNHKEYALIEQEVERVSLILNKLRNPTEAKALIDRQDINRLIMDTAAIFKQTYCAPKRIHLTVVTDPQLGHEVIDETAFKQTITNILKNACEALNSNEEIRIFTHALVHLNEKSYFGITISDNGPGLPNEVRNHLFTPYQSTKGEDRGLGLSIVKDIMHNMQGKIICHSNSDDRVATGTRFQLLFPRQQQ